MNKISKFLMFCFIISWVSWSILAIITRTTDVRFGDPIFYVFFIAGGLGPTFAAFLSMNFGNDSTEYKTFLNQIIKIRVNVLWYAFVLIVPFILFSIPFIINMFSLRAGTELLNKPISVLLLLVVTNILFGGLEEIGWRGVLLPQFMSKFPASIATLLTSLIWSFWHLPLWFIISSPQQNVSPLLFTILGLCFSLILTVIYMNTKSIFLCIITHSLFNSYSAVITMPFTSIYLEFSIMVAFSIGVYIMFRSKRVEVKQVA